MSLGEGSGTETDIEIGLDDSEFQQRLAQVGRDAASINRVLAETARRVRQIGQLTILVLQVQGQAYNESLAIAFEIVAVTIDLLIAVAAAESLTPGLIFQSAGKILLIIELIQLQSEIKALDTESSQKTRANIGILRMLTY